eukprot:Trichotokara_eunicae@DN6324_c0_g2_i10.p1
MRVETCSRFVFKEELMKETVLAVVVTGGNVSFVVARGVWLRVVATFKIFFSKKREDKEQDKPSVPRSFVGTSVVGCGRSCCKSCNFGRNCTKNCKGIVMTVLSDSGSFVTSPLFFAGPLRCKFFVGKLDQRYFGALFLSSSASYFFCEEFGESLFG